MGRAGRVLRSGAAREGACTALWVVASLLACAGCSSGRVRALAGVADGASSGALVVAAVAGQAALWDFAGLAPLATLNPAVALAHAAAGEMRAADAWPVVAAQFAAHLFGVRAARALVDDHLVADVRVFAPPRPTAAQGLSFAQAVAVEAALTALLAFATLAVKRVVSAPLGQSSVMLALVVLITAVGQTTTGSLLNPAMALSLAVFEHGGAAVASVDQSVYWVGPLLGALAAAALFRVLFADAVRTLHEGRRALAATSASQSNEACDATRLSGAVSAFTPGKIALAAPGADCRVKED